MALWNYITLLVCFSYATEYKVLNYNSSDTLRDMLRTYAFSAAPSKLRDDPSCTGHERGMLRNIYKPN